MHWAISPAPSIIFSGEVLDVWSGMISSVVDMVMNECVVFAHMVFVAKDDLDHPASTSTFHRWEFFCKYDGFMFYKIQKSI